MALDQKRSLTVEELRQRVDEAEYEIQMCESGVNSEFWKFLDERWKPIVGQFTAAAMSGTCPDRGFAAGKANGLHFFLNYPAEHVKRKKGDLKMLKNALLSKGVVS